MKQPKPLSELALAHVGRPALIIGGGESAPEQIKLAPAGAVTISVNQHGMLLHKCDYIVACDNKPGRRYVSPKGLLDLRELGAPVISPRVEMADYRIFKIPINNSGCTAAWVAWVMGCSPICLAGMDLYLGKATYFHSPLAHSTGKFLPEGNHLNKWRLLQQALPSSVMLRPLGGPLAGKEFPAYSAVEPISPAPSREEVLAQARGHLVKLVKTGQVIEVGDLDRSIGLRKKQMVAVA